MKLSWIALGSVVAGALIGSWAHAATPKNALGAVAVSPDGSVVVAAGDNRVLYVVDPVSLDVKQRVRIGINPQEAFFSADGKTLSVFDSDGDLYLFAAADWSQKAVLKDGEALAVASGADLAVIIGRPVMKDGAYSTPVVLYSLADGAKKAEGTIAGQAKSIVAASDGSSYAVLLERAADAGETKQQAPAGTNGLARDEFEQKNDGFATTVVRLDSALKETGRTQSWFSSYEVMGGTVAGDAAYFMSYSNKNLKLAGDGTSSLFALSPGYLYGFGLSADGARVAAGSLRDGTLYTLGGGAAADFEIPSAPGWPEYFEGFAFAPDGSAFGGTTSYQLVHVGADGKLIAIKPIF